jgi:hypothetical protein
LRDSIAAGHALASTVVVRMGPEFDGEHRKTLRLETR